MRAAALLLVLALLGAAGNAPRDEGGDLAYAELVVNSQFHGEVLVAITDEDLLVQGSDLEAAGISIAVAKRQRIGGFEFVSLRSLAPALVYVFDETTLVLHLEVQASLLPNITYNVGPHSEAPLRYLQSPSAFLNYSLTAGNSGPLGYSGQVGYNSPKALLTSTMFSDGASFRRGQTYLQYDDRNELITTTVGDAFVNTGTFGGADQVAGITVQRAFALDPYLLRFPAPALSGTVLTPSRASVYVNGVLTRVIDVAPGTFVLDDVPTVSGLNSTVVLLRDAFGNLTRITSQDYSSLDLLRAGLTDFAVSAGMLREDAFNAGDHYGGGVFLGRYARGFTNNFTAGVRAEAGPNVASSGVTAVLAGDLGALGVAYAASRSDGIGDSALQVSFDYQTPRFGFSALSAQTGARYATTSLATTDDRALLAQSLSASIGVSPSGGVTFGIGRTIDRDMGPSSFTSVSLFQAIGSFASVSITALRSTMPAGVSRSFLAQLILRTGPRSTLALDAGNGAAGFQFTSSPPGVFGTSYSASLNTDGSGLQDVRMVGQPAILELSSLKPSSAAPANNSAMLSGSLVAADGRLFLGRPVADGFAVLEGAGSQANVQINGQDAGRSSPGGYLMIPAVQSNADNIVIVDESGEAINESLEAPVRHFTTRSFGGGVLRFETKRTEHVFLGTLRLAGSPNDPTPVAFAPILLTAEGHEQTTQADGDGGFSFDNLPAGAYSGVANLRGTSCIFSITLPPSEAFQIDLGTVFCQFLERSPSSLAPPLR